MHSKMPLVSVIIPAYNHENYIQETINSIINQTYQNIELIIIDDGSVDLTWQKMQEMKEECKKRFQRVIFKSKENEGINLTLNKLLNEAQGEYVYFIASDDLAKPNAIEKQVTFLEENSKYSLVVGDNEIIDENGSVCYWDKNRNNVYSKKEAKFLTFGGFLQHKKKFKFTSDKFGNYETIYPGNYIPNGYLIKKTIFNIIGNFTTEAPLEDYWLMLQVSKYSKMKYIDEVLFSYRWHEVNTIKKTQTMTLYADKTKEYEFKILQNLDKENIIIDCKKILKRGVMAKKQGIPFLFEICTYYKGVQKNKIIKLFNIDLLGN